MFKKVLQSISKSLSSKTPAVAPAPAPVAAPVAKPTAKSKAAAEQPVAKAETPKEKPAATSTAKATAPAPAPKAVAPKTPEELCGIEPKMNKEQVRERLKLLYRRHNRAASSLDAQTRNEADGMLDAIVQIREKFFGEI